MADFSTSDKFDPTKGYGDVRFGSDSTLLETELNELQKIQNHARAEIYRAMVHSGVIEHTTAFGTGFNGGDNSITGQIKVTGGTPIANRFDLTAFNAIINGNKVLIERTPTGKAHNITLPEPPTEGVREDLVFLEAWFEEVDSIKDPAIKDARIGEETSRRTKLNYRIRTVAGVDFSAFPEGFHQGLRNTGAVAYNAKVTAQGGNAQPLEGDVTSETPRMQRQFSHYSTRDGITSAPAIAMNDVGLYVAGKGDQASKDLLKTADGYVYAIPLFRVKRRNSGGYSQNNGNGAINYPSFTIKPKQVATLSALGSTLVEVENGILCEVGDKFSVSTTILTVTAKGTGDFVYLSTNSSQTINWGTGSPYPLTYRDAKRPDGKYANIIHQDDIIDLRNKVSLTGVNYDQLLEENFDKLLRGELRTKEGQKLLKTYHGVPKTPIDANHVFYASLDGTTVAERGTAISSGLNAYTPAPTGLGTVVTSGISYVESALNNLPAITVDLFAKFNDLVGSGGRRYIAFLTNADTQVHVALFIDPANQSFTVTQTGSGNTISYAKGLKKVDLEKWYHFRLVSVNGVSRAYINGELYATITNPTTNPLLFTRAVMGYVTNGWSFNGAMSDVSVSNIDRGNVFATLPKDFIDGYAKIDKAFNMQRRNLSDAQTSQYTTSIAKPKSQVSDRGITVEKGTGVNQTIFEAGDKIKVKGVAGEVITGVIDTDTAVATVTANTGTVTSPTVLSLDNVSSLAVGDTLRLISPDGVVIGMIFTVSSVDTANKTATVTFPNSTVINAGTRVYETTISSSLPIVKFGDGETVRTVAGTWLSLGTNEATFTLGENVNLDTEDVFIEYSLNSPNGQGGIPEVLTELLEGQYLGQKYVKGAPVIKADFRGKVKGSVAENPHKAFTRNSQNFEAPNVNVTEITSYGLLSSVNGQPFLTTSTNISGQSIQQIFSLDLIAEVERQFGRIPKSTKAEKIQWIKDNVNKINLNWSGFGAGVGGNKASIRTFRTSDTLWVGANVVTSSTVTMSTMSFTGANNVGNIIDANGFVHLLAYAEPSDGVTASVINTDYVDLEIEFKSLPGYDTLTPENPYHNGAQKNFFFIRKETKEIEMMFNCDEDFGVVTWGNFVPYQGFVDTGTFTHVTSMNKAYVTVYNTLSREFNGLGAYPIPFTELLPNPNKMANLEMSKKYGSTGMTLMDRFREVTAYSHAGSQASYKPMAPGDVNALMASGLYSLKKNTRTILDHANTLGIVIGVVSLNGELLMLVQTQLLTSNVSAVIGDSSPNSQINMFRLQGKPLIKEAK